MVQKLFDSPSTDSIEFMTLGGGGGKTINDKEKKLGTNEGRCERDMRAHTRHSCLPSIGLTGTGTSVNNMYN